MNDSLQKLIDQLRAARVSHYRGPLEPSAPAPARDPYTPFAHVGRVSPDVELEIELSPMQFIAPRATDKPVEHQEPEPLGDDGLTKAQHRDWYGSTGG